MRDNDKLSKTTNIQVETNINKCKFFFDKPLVKGKILKRYKRFLADVRLENNEVVTVHVPNSGSMKTCWQPDAEVILSDYSAIKSRKLRYTLQAVEMPDGWVGVNTQNPNKVVEQAIIYGCLNLFSGYDFLQSEVKINNKSRLDLMLWKNETDISSFNINKKRIKKIKNTEKFIKADLPVCFIEIKNVTLALPGNVAAFPDAETIRGQKHLQELIELKKAGYKAVILFFVERNSAKSFTVAKHIDAKYAKLLTLAKENGVDMLAIKAKVIPDGLFLYKQLSINL